MTPRSRLLRLKIIRLHVQRGWCQGLAERDGKCCLTGAILRSFGLPARRPDARRRPSIYAPLRSGDPLKIVRLIVSQIAITDDLHDRASKSPRVRGPEHLLQLYNDSRDTSQQSVVWLLDQAIAVARAEWLSEVVA